jgi:hypothetical protein
LGAFDICRRRWHRRRHERNIARPIASAEQGGADDTHQLIQEKKMSFKVYGGTANHAEPTLCHTCRFATVIKGQRLRDEIVECGRLSERSRITFTVASCTAYADSRKASLREMEETAWVLRSDAQRKHIGFIPARQLKPQDRYVLPGDWD